MAKADDLRKVQAEQTENQKAAQEALDTVQANFQTLLDRLGQADNIPADIMEAAVAHNDALKAMRSDAESTPPVPEG